MDITTLVDIINTGVLDKLKSTLEITKLAYFISDSFGFSNTATATSNTASGVTTPFIQVNDFKQYNPKQHDIHDTNIRKDKFVNDDEGRPNGKIAVARLSIPEQKKIVLMAATFLGSPELQANPAKGLESDFLSVINTVFEDNKLAYKFKEISKTTMSERECAELWYTQDAEADFWDGTPMQGSKFKLRMRIISPSRGDTLYPVYDSYGDMIAFGRYFETIELTPNTTDQKNKICHFDIYTADKFYFLQKSEKETKWKDYSLEKTAPGGSDNITGIPNMLKKIPVIYYSQPATEWHDVQEMIERLEKKISNHADSNDYFDSPIVFAEGEVEGFSEKGEQGKVLQGKAGAKVSYLESNGAPESMKMEIDNLIKFIHTYTHTPDISFDNIKGLGTFSGIALKMFFMDAHLKAADKEEIFGQGVQRRINYLKASLAVINSKFVPALRLIIRPKFSYFLPEDVDGEVATIISAYQAGIISLETAVTLNPLVEDAVAELVKIKAEKAAAPPPPPLPAPAPAPDPTPAK